MPRNKKKGNQAFTKPMVQDNVDNDADHTLPDADTKDAKFSITGDDDDVVTDAEMNNAKSDAKSPRTAPTGKYSYTSSPKENTPSPTATAAASSSSSSSSSSSTTATVSDASRPSTARTGSVEFPTRPSIFTAAQPAGSYRPPRESDYSNDYAIPIDNSDHWEDEHIHLARSPRDSLKMYRKEIAIITFLLVVGLVCLIVGLVRLFSVASGGSLILLVIGVITLIPGCYFGNEFVKSYRDGTPFRAMDF
eukprot:TRINITY_DN56678_c0_g1_i1.p1 TRINITY_DN56678_c0_g1~~TRINITY_DN56678_c0_g1_i1.p1  ORF type:complete len:249 (+),score=17.77 TRINITY_DN56678_c0_g1_i1:15-761(+)